MWEKNNYLKYLEVNPELGIHSGHNFILYRVFRREPRHGHGGDVHGPGLHAPATGLGREEYRARIQDVQTRRSAAPPAQPHLFQGATLRATRLW